MERFWILLACPLLALAGCAGEPDHLQIEGRLLVPAEITALFPEEGSPCEPSRHHLGVTVMSVRDDRGDDHPLQVGSGTILWPDDEKNAGEQWCQMTWSGEIPDSDGPYALKVGGFSHSLKAEDLLQDDVWVVVGANGIEVGRG